MANKKYKHLYTSPRWRKLRIKLFKENPLCVICKSKGIITAASELDHKTQSSKLSKDEFYNIQNLQFLCNSCHVEKTRLENYNRSKLLECDDDGNIKGDFDENGYLKIKQSEYYGQKKEIKNSIRKGW